MVRRRFQSGWLELFVLGKTSAGLAGSDANLMETKMPISDAVSEREAL